MSSALVWFLLFRDSGNLPWLMLAVALVSVVSIWAAYLMNVGDREFQFIANFWRVALVVVLAAIAIIRVLR